MATWARRSSTASARPARCARGELRQARHHACHQRAAAAQRRQDRAPDHRRLPRRAGDRPRQPHAAVQPALPPRAAAGPARAALRGRRSGWTAPARSVRRSRRASSAPSPMRLRSRRSRPWRSASSTRTSSPTHEQAAAAELRRLLPDVVRHHRHRADPRVARVRAHRDRCRQCLCGPAGQQLHRRVRSRPAQRRVRGLVAADGLAWRRDLGRARLPRADHAGGIRPGRRLHRRRGLRQPARRSTIWSPSTWAAPRRNAR